MERSGYWEGWRWPHRNGYQSLDLQCSNLLTVVEVLANCQLCRRFSEGEVSAWRPSSTAHPSCISIFLSHHPAHPSFSSSLSGDLLRPWTLIDSFFLLSWPLELSSSILVVLEYHMEESAHGMMEHLTSLLVAYTIEKFPSYQQRG